MSVESATEFIQRASTDQAFHDRFVGAASRPNSEGKQDYQGVAALGRSEGYDFTVKELRQAFKDYRASLTAQSRELTDFEVEAVSGGVFAGLASGYNPT